MTAASTCRCRRLIKSLPASGSILLPDRATISLLLRTCTFFSLYIPHHLHPTAHSSRTCLRLYDLFNSFHYSVNSK